MSVSLLVAISRRYGADPDYVLAGGGNTSWKDGDTLYVKGSGQPLANAVPESFVKMDRGLLARIWEKQYPETSAERESAVLADMMAARKAGEEQKRPSVETLLHDILPFAFVVHTHPALVNGLTCSRRGEEAMNELFGESAIWIPATNPGYVLSKTVKTALDAYHARHGRPAALIFLQNHGIFTGADSPEGIHSLYRSVMEKIAGRITRRPDFAGETTASGGETDALRPALAELAGSGGTGGAALFLRNNEIAALVTDRASFAPVASAFSPDHIVYAGSDPLFTAAKTAAALREDWRRHVEKTGRNPKIAAVQGRGVFGVGPTEHAAALALDLFRDAARVAVYAESFGGGRFMSREHIDFINNWEVERFRSSVSIK
jgi:rhamnose utilization protein RhaD (predicted bifunctional aldolase and dehydrogenase)